MLQWQYGAVALCVLPKPAQITLRAMQRPDPSWAAVVLSKQSHLKRRKSCHRSYNQTQRAKAEPPGLTFCWLLLSKQQPRATSESTHRCPVMMPNGINFSLLLYVLGKRLSGDIKDIWFFSSAACSHAGTIDCSCMCFSMSLEVV